MSEADKKLDPPYGTFDDEAAAPPALPPDPEFRFEGHIDKLFSELAKAQGTFPEIPRTKKVEMWSKGKPRELLYSYDYSPLDNTQKILRPILSKHGIAVVQPPASKGNAFRVLTIMAGHGARIISEIGIPRNNNPKEHTGLFTYFQRAAYEGMCGVKADSDEEPHDGRPTAGGVAEKLMTEDQGDRLRELTKRLGLSNPALSKLCKEVAEKPMPSDTVKWSAGDAATLILKMLDMVNDEPGADK